MTRDETINAILDAAATPCPAIVEVLKFRNIHTGATCGICGFPFNFKREDYERIFAGYCYADKNGTTYGIPADTREELAERHAKRESAKRADFRAILETDTPEELQIQADYWLGQLTL